MGREESQMFGKVVPKPVEDWTEPGFSPQCSLCPLAVQALRRIPKRGPSVLKIDSWAREVSYGP